MIIINPATEQEINTLSEDTPSKVAERLQTLRNGQKAWQALGVSKRLEIITRFGELIKSNTEELANILTSETGKPIQQSRNEINGAHNRIDHLQTNAEKWLASEKLVEEGQTLESIQYEPLGVVANISAWNFPYNVGYNVFLYALVAGNAVLYKPSEFSSLTGLEFEKYLHQAGVPKDVFMTAIGGKEVGQAILELDFDGYFFTGSYATGKHIIQTVAPKMVPVQLELGGKDPLYIMDDVADIKQSAINAAEGAFYNNGQSCCAVERIYVHEKIYDEFVEELVKEVKGYKIGDPKNKDTFIGAITRPQQIEILDNQVNEALEKGAQKLTGGNALEGVGYFYEPVVLVGVNHDMKIMKEESFGPIIGIQKVSSDEEAIDLMKDTAYGLTSAVFSADEERAKAVLSEMNTGTVYWNCCDRVSPNLPWSGRGNSGVGSTLSSQGIRAFVQPKAYQMRP
ncbi:aldehyde dehydrogenase family protein [Reichenbachiella versicolor]|uniref:aldehyde dehydrogenase family protein n=1 Tax=Reichenbachiella versicolor TaxID=1821036 RepID=UPI000D6E3780|nr:aldehyde dehydrogenase family protein [Reichenbachiella versicolor]